MSLVPKEILLSHLQRAEGAEEVTLPIDFFRDLLYQAMPRTWVGLTNEEMRLIDPDGFEDNLPQMIQQALKEKNT